MSYTIKQVAERFNLTEYAIRYYEKEGLLPDVSRDEHGVRHFDEDAIEWIKLICCLRNTGMAISKIKDFVELCLEGDSTLELRREIILVQKRINEEKLQEMNNNLDMINRKLRHYNTLINEKNEKFVDCCKGNCSLNSCDEARVEA